MKEERVLKLDVEDIIKILAEHFDVNESDVILESYRNTNDFGDVDEGILCEIRKNI